LQQAKRKIKIAQASRKRSAKKGALSKGQKKRLKKWIDKNMATLKAKRKMPSF
jgi:hypothetical protein